MIKTILVAIDHSEPAAAAARAGAELAHQLGARVVLVHVIDIAVAYVPEVGLPRPEVLAELRREATELLKATKARLSDLCPIETLMLEGEPAQTIMDAVEEEHADILFLGTDSRGRLAHFLLGSTADCVIRRASCPVVTVRPAAFHLKKGERSAVIR